MITVTVDDKDVQKALKGLAGRMADMKPALKDMGEHLSETTKARFVKSTAPDGSRWAPNSPVTLARARGFKAVKRAGKAKGFSKPVKAAGGKRPLVGETKSLATTIFYRAAPASLVIASPMVYAAAQQFGAKQGAFGRTRRGAPIPWGNIPARPFLGLSAEDVRVIVEIARGHIQEG